MATPFVLTARIQTALDTGSLTRVINRIRREMAARPIELKVIVDDARLRRLATELGTVDASARKAQAGMAGFANSVKLAATRFMAFTLAASVMIKLSMAFREGFKQAAEFDREIVRLTQVTGKSAQGLKPLVREITNLSESLGVSSLKMVEMSRILAQTGLSARDTAVALRAIAKTELAPTFSDIKKTAEGAIAAMRQFNIEARDLEATLGAINAVSKRFAVESDDIITAIRRTGGVFQAAGGQINELIAIFTSVRATTRETAETIATGLRTIFTRIQRPKTIKFLRQFGIELTDLQGKFVGPMEAIRRLSVSLRGMATTDLQFGRIIEQLGGFRQVGKVIPMITKHETAVKALAVAQGGANSLTVDAAKAQKALLVQVEKVKEEFHDMMRKMLASEGFKAMISMTLKLASAMIKLVESLEPVLPMLMALSAIKLGGMAMGGIGRMRVGGMAKGGVVPGVGNRDTVPAVLTPGEFVIKKSSAKKLGYDNLSGMNKYAAGGRVDLGGSFGGAFLQPKGVKDAPQNRQWKGSIGSGAALANKINLAMVGGVGKKGGKGELADPYKGRLKEQLNFSAPGANKTAFANQLIRTNPAVAAKWMGGPDKLAAFQESGRFPRDMSPKSMKWFQGQVSPRNMRAAMGRSGMFLAMQGMGKQQVLPANIGSTVLLSGMSNEFGINPKDAESFRSIYNLHAERMITDFGGGAAPRWRDIQSRAGGDAVEGHMFEAYLLANANSPEFTTDSSENFDLYSTTHNPKISRLFGPNAGGIRNLDAKRTFDPSSQASIIKKAANEFAQKGAGSGITATYTPFTGQDKTPRRLMAAGGSVGSDTVPALLTPGEFVINKKSASRIGLSALSSMNRYHTGGPVPGGPAPGLPSTSPAGPGTGSGRGGGAGMGGMGMMMMLTMIPALIPQLADMGGATEETTQQVQDFSGIMMGATMGLMLFGNQLTTAGGAAVASGLIVTAAVVAYGHTMQKAADRAKEDAIKRGAREEAMLKAEEGARHGMATKFGAVGGAIGIVIGGLIAFAASMALLPAAATVAVVAAIGAIGAYFLGFDFGADAAAEAARKETAARMDAIDATKKFAEGMKNIDKHIKSGNLAAASAGFVTEITELSKAIEAAKSSGVSLDSEELSTMTDRMSDAGAATATHLSRVAVEAAKAGSPGGIGAVIGANKELIKAHGTAKSAALALAAAQARAAAIAMSTNTAPERKARNAALKRASDMDVKAAMIRFDAEKDIKAQMKADFEQQKRHTEALKANTALFLHQARIVNDLGTVMTALSVATMEAADTMRGISAAASLGMGKVGATKLKGTRGGMLSGNLADADTTEYANLLNQLFAPLGQLGATIGKELTQAQDAFSGASEFVVQHTNTKTGQMMKGWEGDLRKHLKNVPKALQDKILNSINDIEGPKTPEKIKEALKEAEGYLDPVKKQAMQLYKLQLDHVNRLNSAYDKQRKLLGAMAKSQKDWVSHGFKAMAVMRKHMGMESSLALAQGQHAAEQQAILGQAGLGGLGGNIAGMGNHLRSVNKKIVAAEKSLEGMVGDPTRAGLAADNLAKLKNESETLTKALKHAGNMAGQRAVIEEKIAKAKAERESRKGLLEEFTFGSGKERGKLAKDLKVTQFAAAVGDMDKIPGKLRGTVLKTLDRFKDTLIPGSGGRTGQEVKNQLMARQAQKMGANPQQIQRILMRGREEEMLIAMLGQLFMAESAARMELMQTQKDMHIVLTNDIQKLHMDFVNKLTQVLQQIQGGAGIAAGGAGGGRQFPGGAGGAMVPAVGGQGVPGGGTAGQRPGRIQANQAAADARAAQEEADKAADEKKAAKKRADHEKAQREKVDRAVEREENRRRVEEANRRERNLRNVESDIEFSPMARGGVIYAKGGFQARGTDTVPAMLTPGEFVIRKSSAQKIGYGNLHSINRYDQGGEVHKHPHRSSHYTNDRFESDVFDVKRDPGRRLVGGRMRGSALTEEQLKEKRKGQKSGLSIPRQFFPNFQPHIQKLHMASEKEKSKNAARPIASGYKNARDLTGVSNPRISVDESLKTPTENLPGMHATPRQLREDAEKRGIVAAGERGRQKSVERRAIAKTESDRKKPLFDADYERLNDERRKKWLAKQAAKPKPKPKLTTQQQYDEKARPAAKEEWRKGDRAKKEAEFKRREEALKATEEAQWKQARKIAAEAQQDAETPIEYDPVPRRVVGPDAAPVDTGTYDSKEKHLFGKRAAAARRANKFRTAPKYLSGAADSERGRKVRKDAAENRKARLNQRAEEKAKFQGYGSVAEKKAAFAKRKEAARRQKMRGKFQRRQGSRAGRRLNRRAAKSGAFGPQGVAQTASQKLASLPPDALHNAGVFAQGGSGYKMPPGHASAVQNYNPSAPLRLPTRSQAGLPPSLHRTEYPVSQQQSYTASPSLGAMKAWNEASAPGGPLGPKPQQGGGFQKRFRAGVDAPGGPMDFRAPQQGFGRESFGRGVNVSGIASQVQDALGPVMAQFQGVNVEHNINHQGLDVTGGDGIGSAIIQQILPEIVGLIKNITTQLINNSSQDATGKITTRPG